MADTEEKKKDINVESEDFKAGYRQGYIDGADNMADRILAKLHKINIDKDDHK